MDLLLLAFTAVATVIFLPIYLLFRTHKMKAQIAALEQKVNGLVTLVSEILNAIDVGESIAAPEVATSAHRKPKVVSQGAPSTVKTADVRPEPVQNQTPKAFVFKSEFREKAIGWLQKNWFFAVAAVSLALAGVFLVQYGVENSLLSPARRVSGAILLGGILVGAGEFVRRKLGPDEDGSFALLPSAFSGAGLISAFSGILAARMMYDLIGPEVAFAGLVMTGVLAMVLGWFYGPLLAIVGVFGALAAPFLVGGASDTAHFLHFYFAGIAAVALAIDMFKRWAWLSALGLIGSYLAAAVLFAGDGHAVYFIGFALITAGLATALPVRALVPQHVGSRLSAMLLRKDGDRIYPEFPTRLGAGGIIASTLFMGVGYVVDPSVFWLALAGIGVILAASIFWMQGASALRDMAYLPAAIGLGVIALEAVSRGDIQQAWLNDALRPELDFASPVLAVLLIAALGVSLAFAWRSSRNGDLKLVDAGIVAVYAPIAAIIAEVSWSPSNVLGSGNWALYLSVIAIVMTILAERFSRKDGADRLRTAMFALSAISMLSFVLIVMLGSFALTLALGVMIVTASWMGRKFDLPLFDRYMQVGVVTLSWRLVLDPGVIWAFEADLWQAILAYVGVIGLLVAAYLVKRKDVRQGVNVMLESAIWSLFGVFLTVMMSRYFDNINLDADYLAISLVGLIWLISSANQLYRIREGVGLRRTRITLASIYAVLGGVLTVLSLVGFNPLNGIAERDGIAGPYVLDSVFAAYALPGLLLAFVALRFTHLGMKLRRGLGVIGALLMTFYIGLEIRRWWHGDDIRSYLGTFDGELYSYTVAMMLAAAALLVLAFMRQSTLLRRLALVAVGLTVAKVYLIDMSGLDGLLRVVSFLVFGLVLIAMAWVNRILQKNEEG